MHMYVYISIHIHIYMYAHICVCIYIYNVDKFNTIWIPYDVLTKKITTKIF